MVMKWYLGFAVVMAALGLDLRWQPWEVRRRGNTGWAGCVVNKRAWAIVVQWHLDRGTAKLMDHGFEVRPWLMAV
jgi:hypothetical protein